MKLSNYETVGDIDKAIESLSKVAERYKDVPRVSRPYALKVKQLKEFKKKATTEKS